MADRGLDEFDSYDLHIEAHGPDKAARKRLLNDRLRRATEKILKGEFPDQERTTFSENMGGGGGP